MPRGPRLLPLPRLSGIVTLYRLTLPRRPRIDCQATLRQILDPAHDLYRVRFLDETVPWERLAHPSPWPADPEAMPLALLGRWRMSHYSEALTSFLVDDASLSRGEA